MGADFVDLNWRPQPKIRKKIFVRDCLKIVLIYSWFWQCGRSQSCLCLLKFVTDGRSHDRYHQEVK